MTDGRRRVVVTGMGAVTPLGNNVATFWSRLVAGESGIDRIRINFDPSRLTSQIAGEVKDFDPSHVLDRKEIRRNDRYTQFALVATAEAMEQAGLPERLEGEIADRTGVIIGSGIGGSGTIVEQVSINATRGPDRISPFFIPMGIANMASGQSAISFGARGPNWGTVSACATAGHGIGEATETIIRDDADMMFAGGSEAAVFEALVGGFVIAEGAGVLVLEELEHARRRGAQIFAEVIGYGATGDASHITLPAPGGEGGARAARRAIEKAGLTPQDIDHVSAHATSTPEGDPAELMGFKSVFGESIGNVSISAIKGSIGHTLGAAGGIGAIAAIQAMRESRVPPTLNLMEPSPEAVGIDLTPLKAREREVRAALVNSFGFGGQNAAVVLRRWDDA
ncbi:MAG TPA: beta-ketoacyl synthase N-terminal-like domain-containing protein [Candidatus Limnocylindria bacterium]|nr:beta-ketoacyl synthase N-terminal-like domain-containing protein [Candidatus Limnocylindria bacterium]